MAEGNEPIGNLTNCAGLGPKRDALAIVIPITVIYVVIFITGTIGNISTCVVISRNKSMHTATNYYLFSLAISDLLLLVTGLPQEIYLIWFRYPYVFGSAFCFLRGLFAETSANATVLTITAFTVERYLAICHPFLSHTMSKLSRASKFILAIWCLAVCAAMPQAIQFKLVEERNCKSCVFEGNFIKHSFEVSTLVFFVGPMTLISVLYVLIGLKLKSSNVMAQRNSSCRMQTKSSKKIVKMLVAVVVAFFICWAPFHAQRLFYNYSIQTSNKTTRPLYLKIYVIVTYISGVLYYVSATINPILYNIMSVKFREAFKETFTRCCGLYVKSGRPQRSYSVLSRSAQRGPDSSGSGRDDPTVQTHTSISHKDSIESTSHTEGERQRCSSYLCTKPNDISEEYCIDLQKEHRMNPSVPPCGSNLAIPGFVRAHVRQPSISRLDKVFKFFRCGTKRSWNEKRTLSAYYASPIQESGVLFESENKLKSKRLYKSSSHYDISNSSLKAVDNGVLKDELNAYINDVTQNENRS